MSTDNIDAIEERFNKIKNKRIIAESERDKILKKVKEDFGIKTKAAIEKQLDKVEKELDDIEKKKKKLIEKIEDKLDDYDEL